MKFAVCGMTCLVAQLVSVGSPVAAAAAGVRRRRRSGLVAGRVVAVAEGLKQRSAAAQKQDLDTKSGLSQKSGNKRWFRLGLDDDLHVVGLHVKHLHARPRAVQIIYDQVPEVVAVTVLLQGVHLTFDVRRVVLERHIM